MLTTEGIRYLLELLTKDEALPDVLYVGWCTNDTIQANTTMTDLTELSGNGYARQPFYPGIAAQGTLTLESQPMDGDTMTIGSVTYRFKLTMSQAEDIQIGVSLVDTQENIRLCLNGTGTEGVDYYAGTTAPHPQVSAAAWNSNDCVLTALVDGVAGNDIATTEDFSTSCLGYFDATTLGTTREGGGELTSEAGGLNGWSVITKTLTFEAIGGDWSLAKWMFMTTTLTGTAGALIAVEDLNEGSGITLTDGQAYDVTMTILGEPQ